MRVAVLAAILCAATAAHAQAPLTVGVEPAALPADLIADTCAEADAIWRRAGVAIAFRTDGSRSDVRVVFDSPPPAPAGRSLALGWLIFSADAPDPTIHLSVANILRLLDDSTSVVGPAETLKPWQRDTLLARALGRALAHELGHFLGGPRHASSGLMRAQQTGAELFEPGRARFAIDPRTRDAAVTHLAALSARR